MKRAFKCVICDSTTYAGMLSGPANPCIECAGDRFVRGGIYYRALSSNKRRRVVLD